MRESRKTTLAPVSLVALALLLFPGGLPGQSPLGASGGFGDATYLAAGYVVNAPDQMMGFSAMALGPVWEEWGLYVDAKITTDSPGEDDAFDPNRTASDVPIEDELFQQENAWRSLNGAIVRSVGSQLAFYAGGGVSRMTAYDEYRSDELAGTADAYYWVEDEASSQTRPKLVGGAIFRFTRNLIFQFGAETNPVGATIGAGLALPLD